MKKYSIQNKGSLIIKQKDKNSIKVKDVILKRNGIVNENKYRIQSKKITIRNNEIVDVDDFDATTFLIIIVIVLLSVLIIALLLFLIN